VTIVAAAYLWAGERDALLQLLAQFAKLPYGPTAGDLKLNPVWDEIRGIRAFPKSSPTPRSHCSQRRMSAESQRQLGLEIAHVLFIGRVA